MTKRDLTGNRFGRWIVIEEVEPVREPSGHLRHRWLCRCDCGTVKSVKGASLIAGRSLSCGCERAENNAKRMTKHNMYRTRLYKVWEGMKSRCDNPHNDRYKNYGGRGIDICDSWRKDFLNFYEWAINNGYKDDLTIDRINVNGNYEPDNCKWSTPKEQANNRTNNHSITYDGKTLTIAQWADLLGINSYILYQRIVKRRWTIERAFTTPVKERGCKDVVGD